jgi:NitT/TauT family transport system substrate-binding protein
MRFGRAGHLVAIALVAVLGLSGCGGSNTSAGGSADGSGPEKTTLVVGVVPVPDVAPLFIAIQRGFFRDEGLTVKPEILQSSALAGPKVHSGAMDFSLVNYVTAFAKGASDWRIVADCYQAGPDTFLVMTTADSPIRTVGDLKGKRVGVAAVRTISDLLVGVSLKTVGIGQNGVKWVPTPLPGMEAALKAGKIDAGLATEPFITSMQSDIGARKVADTATGSMDGFPIAGWATIQGFADKNPMTVAAFQRAMGRAQRLAANDRTAVEGVLPAYTKITPQIASIMSLGSFPTTLSTTRLQRVADVMQAQNWLSKKVNVQPMVVTGGRRPS